MNIYQDGFALRFIYLVINTKLALNSHLHFF